MARIRTIKPDFFASEDVAVLPFRARLTWIGLWTYVDDEGRTKDNPRIIKGALYSLDNVTADDVEADLDELAKHGRILRYEVAGVRYLQVTNFRDHQVINRPTPSRIPPPSAAMTDLSTAAVSSNDGSFRDASVSTHARKGKERKGMEGDAREHGVPRELTTVDSPMPPRKCPEHVNTRNPPSCGKCKDARQAHDEWQTAQRARIAASPKCQQHRGELAHNCRACAAERKAAS